MHPNIELFFIKTLPDEYLERTLETLKSTDINKSFVKDYTIVEELDTREQTLNNIIKIRNKKKDTLIIADDILFRDGWLEALEKSYQNGDIIGFSMIDAKKGLLQDFGYDFIQIDGKLSYQGLHKYESLDNFSLPTYRYCDSVCGCAMLVKSHVFDIVAEFPQEGSNRWGEMIFSHLAARQGLKTIVLSAHLEHYGISTKQKDTVKESSLSWLVERELWDYAVENHLFDVTPIKSVLTVIDKKLKNKIEETENILIYGCGVNADRIISILDIKKYVVCSGLQEEIGKMFHGECVMDVDLVDFELFDNIMITPIGYDSDILPKFSGCRIEQIVGLNLATTTAEVVITLRSMDPLNVK
jgi:hypothetical protein